MNRDEALSILRSEAEAQNRERIAGKPVDPGGLYAVIEWLEGCSEDERGRDVSYIEESESRGPGIEGSGQDVRNLMPDQPAPDFEEARKRVSDAVQEARKRFVDGTPGRYPLTLVTVRILDVEALLSERGAREEQIEVALYHFGQLERVGQGPPPQTFWDRLRAIKRALATPATESAQAEEEGNG